MKKKYANSFAAMHWIHAIILIFILIGAIVNLPELPPKGGDLTPFKGHMILGAVATLFTIVRLILLLKQPNLEPLNISPLRESIIRWNHRFIYLFLLVTGISGIATVKSANIDKVVIFGKDISLYSGNDGIVSTFAAIHSFSAYTLLALIVMHIAGTLLYMLKTKENILLRVGFSS